MRGKVYRFLERVGRVIDVEWGDHFSVTWGSVTLPSSMKDDYDLFLRHAEVLLTRFPANPETVTVARTIAVAKGIRPELFSSFVSDLIACHIILKEGSEPRYLNALRYISTQYGSPLGELLLCFGYRTAGRQIVAAHNISTAVHRLKTILEYSLPVTRKLEMLADVLSQLIGSGGGLAAPERPGEEDGDDLYRAMALAELDPEILERAIDEGGGYSQGPDDEIVFLKGPLSSAMMMKLFSRINEVRPKRNAGGERFYEQWVIGDDPQKLLVRDTLRVFGAVIPPVASLKLGGSEEGSSERGGEALVVMDVSTSMRGRSAYHCRLAAAAIVFASVESGMNVSVCFFNGSHLLKRYGRNPEGAIEDIASVVFGGGTALGDALEACLRVGEFDSVHVITDTEIDDVNERKRVLNLLSTFAKRADVTVYALEQRPGQSSWMRGEWALEVVRMGEEFTDRPFMRHKKLYQ